MSLLFQVNEPRLAVTAFGLRFKNPIGLAAGYDKNGVAVKGLAALGFGHIEVGTVTRLPQLGHPKPRVHRLPEAHAIINRMGFPNAGAEALQARLPPLPIGDTRLGINLGKGKDTPLERAAEDYSALLTQFHTRADYATINLSSPNTPGLRQLQTRAYLNELLAGVMRTRNTLPRRVPVLVKIAPDLSEGEIDEVLMAVKENGVDGLIATNTTTSRAGVPERAVRLEGGLSGAPLRARSTAVIRYIAQQTAGQLPIIGVGGIMSTRDVLEKLEAGATLVQVYTGLVYAGPGLAKTINHAVLHNRQST